MDECMYVLMHAGIHVCIYVFMHVYIVILSLHVVALASIVITICDQALKNPAHSFKKNPQPNVITDVHILALTVCIAGIPDAVPKAISTTFACL